MMLECSIGNCFIISVMFRKIDDKFWLTYLHYGYVERQEGNHFVRISRSGGGKTVSEGHVSNPKSSYELEVVSGNEGALTAKRAFVKDRITGEIVGENVDYLFYGGWVERLIGSISDAHSPPLVGRCIQRETVDQIIDLVTTVLKPTKNVVFGE